MVGEQVHAGGVPVADVVLQTEYSLFERDTETLFPTLDELGVGYVAYSPLGRGFITGTAKAADQYEATDIRTVDPRWQPGNFEKNVEAVDRLAELAATKGATVSQLALAPRGRCPPGSEIHPGTDATRAGSGEGVTEIRAEGATR